MSELISLSVDPIWNMVLEIKDQIATCLADRDRNMIDATTIAAVELLENAVKYGRKVESCSRVEFHLRISEGQIIIEVSNGVSDREDGEIILGYLEKIKASDNPELLYCQRLQELIENPSPGVSQLGLYRIVYEAKFSLDYTFENNMLTITATRDLA